MPQLAQIASAQGCVRIDHNALKSLGQFSTNDQSTFLVADGHLGNWAINFGVGKGYGGNADSLIIKSVVSIPLPQFRHHG